MGVFDGWPALGWRVGSWWPGVLLAIFGSTLNNMGTNVMKLAYNRRQSLPIAERPRVSAMPLWLSGFAMFTLGTAMSFGAFKFAAQSLLSGLGSVQFLSQVFFSRFILHERIEEYAYGGVLLIIAGCTMLVIFGAHDTKNYRPEELAALYGRSEYVCYMLGAGALACAVALSYSSIRQRIARRRGMAQFDISVASVRERQVLAALFSINSALFGSQAVVLAKALSMLLIQALHPNPLYSNPFRSYQTYFIFVGFVAAATYWVTRLTAGLRLFDAVYLVPMMQICWILFSTLAGGIYYEEFIGFGRREYGAYVIGFICVLGGVALLCPRDEAKSLNAADVIYDIVTDENPAYTKKMGSNDYVPKKQGDGDALARAEEGNGKRIETAKDRTGKYTLLADEDEDEEFVVFGRPDNRGTEITASPRGNREEHQSRRQSPEISIVKRRSSMTLSGEITSPMNKTASSERLRDKSPSLLRDREISGEEESENEGQTTTIGR